MDEPAYSATTAVRRRRNSGSFQGGLIHLIVGASLLVVAGPCRAQPGVQTGQADPEPICAMLESAARANALPVGFFARLIWRESHFHPDAVGPDTRSGAHALGIAQFMPETAIEQQLLEPFDPKQALPKSGAFLAELRDEFGNLGLAAAAYNAGPQRVRDFLAGARDLPQETRSYVLAITGQPVEEWTKAASDSSAGQNTGEPRLEALPMNCDELIASLERSFSSVKPLWLQKGSIRNVPSWCRGLSHPNVTICGPVRALEPALRAAAAHGRNKLPLAKSLL
jgi:hypothetical protein